MNTIKNISPLDGRYKISVKDLEDYFSEYAFIRYRVLVEIEYLIKLCKELKIDVNPIELRKIYTCFNDSDAQRIKEIEETTKHDAKAIEYFLREKINNEKISNFIHFGLTTDDIENIAYSVMIKKFLSEIYFKNVEELISKILDLAISNKSVAMLARTHGQPASPTTLGKEFIYFANRLHSYLLLIKNTKLEGKLNGAVGNYNSFKFAVPELEIIKFSQEFIESFDLKPNLITTQINPDINLLNLFSIIINFNNVLIDMCQDIWSYISFNYFIQSSSKGSVGSSTMPHKINPIKFENAEGNIKLANNILKMFIDTLSISRFQRDLSNKTIKRNYGLSFGYSILAYKNIIKGLSEITPNYEVISKDLNSHPEILTEAYQTYLRKINYPNPYEFFKERSRIQNLTLQDLHGMIDTLKIDNQCKDKLKRLKIEEYIGLAESLVELKYNEIKKEM